MFLWNAGFWTFSACQGGEGHPSEDPFIRVYAKPSSTTDQTRAEVTRFLLEAGYRGFGSSSIYFHALNQPASIVSHGLVEIRFCRRLPVLPHTQEEIEQRLLDEEERLERNRQAAIRKAERAKAKRIEKAQAKNSSVKIKAEPGSN